MIGRATMNRDMPAGSTSETSPHWTDVYPPMANPGMFR